MKKISEKFIVYLYKKYGLTPDMLTYSRIFSAPLLALFVSKSISSHFGIFTIFTLVLYFIIVATDFFDGLLARYLSKTENHDHAQGGMLDRLSDKMLIILLLIPFGLNIFTFLIISGELMLAYQALNSAPSKKQATKTGKLKMLFQAFLIPILIISRSTNLLSDYIVAIYVIATIGLTYASMYSHFIDND